MIGLTLEGGGAKGAYQIGAWKAFREKGIQFDGVAGTSVGALNGAMILQDDFDLAWETWYNIEPSRVLSIDDEINELITDWKLDQKNVGILIEEIRKIVKNSGVDTSPLYDLVQRMICEDKIRRSPKDFGFVTYSLTDMEPLELFKEDVPQGKLADYLMASSYLPIFKDRKFDGKRFLDGSFYNNLPINMLLRKQYPKIYAVRLYGRGRILKIDPGDTEIIYICPERELGRVLNFSTEQSRRNLQLGYLDTLKVLDHLDGKHYYIYGAPTDEEALEALLRWSGEIQRKICAILDLDHQKTLNRIFMEEAIPQMIDVFELPKESSHKDLLLTLIEAIAKSYELESLKQYSFQEWAQKIKNAQVECKVKRDHYNKAAYLIKASESLMKIGKEKKRHEIVTLLKNDKQWLDSFFRR